MAKEDDEGSDVVEPGRIALDEKPMPDVGRPNALVRITTTTICGTLPTDG